MRTTFAAAVVALVPLVAATGNKPPLPPCLTKHDPFISKGCYKDESGSSPALIYRSGSNQQDMTVEQCIDECKGNGYRYAGLKYYGVCYCGSALNGPKVADDQCSFPCSGNKDEICGGDSELSVWEDPTFTTDLVDVSVSDFESLGCYSDDAPEGRALSFHVNVPAMNFTPDTCVDACRVLGLPYAGTEYGVECWCGTNLGTYSDKVDSKECDVKCKGDDSLTCGGRSRLEVFYAGKLESAVKCGIDTPTLPPVSLPPLLPTTSKTTTASTPPETKTTSSVEEIISTSSVEKFTSTSVIEDLITTSVVKPTTTFALEKPTSTPDEAVTTQPPVTTEKPISTTLKPSTTSICTATHTSEPDCEFKHGKWCASPLPDWNDKTSCLTSAKSCALQVSSCFKTAGWPGVLDCFEFSSWCGNVKEYCSNGCKHGRCGKKDCWSKHKPEGGKEPVISISVYPCPTSTIKTSTIVPSTTLCPPQPTNICKQPTNDYWGYSPENPVAGLELPVVGCNDIKQDFKNKPFKLYNSPNSRHCPAFQWHQRSNVCDDACEEQYEECRDTYVEGCSNNDWGRWRKWHHKRAEEDITEVERRTWGSDWHGWAKKGSSHSYHGSSSCAAHDSKWEWAKKGCDESSCWGKGGNDKKNANKRCKAQYKDCLAENKRTTPGNSCKQWCAAA